MAKRSSWGSIERYKPDALGVGRSSVPVVAHVRVSQRFQEQAAQAVGGKPFAYVPWKNLRNSYATMLHARGVDLADVARLLGHTTPVITYQHYDRPSAEQLAAIVGVLREKK